MISGKPILGWTLDFAALAALAVLALGFAAGQALGDPASPESGADSSPADAATDRDAGPPVPFARIGPRTGPLRSLAPDHRPDARERLVVPGLRDGGFEEGAPNPHWEESSVSFGSPICNEEICGTGPGADGLPTAGPRPGGEWWAWFGGFPGRESSSLEQTVTFPGPCGARQSLILEFWLWHGAASGNGRDSLRVRLGEEHVVFELVDGMAAPTADYRRVRLLLHPPACAGPLPLRFEGETYDMGVSNFSVDDLTIRPAGPLEIPALGPAGLALLLVMLALCAVRRL